MPGPCSLYLLWNRWACLPACLLLGVVESRERSEWEGWRSAAHFSHFFDSPAQAGSATRRRSTLFPRARSLRPLEARCRTWKARPACTERLRNATGASSCTGPPCMGIGIGMGVGCKLHNILPVLRESSLLAFSSLPLVHKHAHKRAHQRTCVSHLPTGQGSHSSAQLEPVGQVRPLAVLRFAGAHSGGRRHRNAGGDRAGLRRLHCATHHDQGLSRRPRQSGELTRCGWSACRFLSVWVITVFHSRSVLRSFLCAGCGRGAILCNRRCRGRIRGEPGVMFVAVDGPVAVRVHPP